MPIENSIRKIVCGYYPMLCWGKLCGLVQPVLNCHFSGNEIVEGLWISNLASVCNLQALEDRNISYIVTAVLGVTPRFENDIRYDCLPVRDTADENISIYFDSITESIRTTLVSGENVLVHCKCGVSRSVTLVAAYLIRYEKMTAHEAVLFIQSKRPKANPIPEFRRQLEEYADKCRREEEP